MARGTVLISMIGAILLALPAVASADDEALARTVVVGADAVKTIQLLMATGISAVSERQDQVLYRVESLACTRANRRCILSATDPGTQSHRTIYLGPGASGPMMDAILKDGAKLRDEVVRVTALEAELTAAGPDAAVLRFTNLNPLEPGT